MADKAFDKFQKQELTKPRDKAWENFAKFEKVGDKVTGILKDVFYRPEELKSDGTVAFKAQRGFTLEQADGVLINVALRREPYFAIRHTDNVKLGDLLTVTFAKEIPSKEKGYNATKVYEFEGGTLPENADNPTVRQLEAEDALSQGVNVGLNVEPEEVKTEELEETEEDDGLNLPPHPEDDKKDPA